MEIKKITYPKQFEHYNKSILQIKKEELDIQFGTVLLKKGTRIPEKGFTKHPSHEISIIQKGRIEMLNEDGSVLGYLQTGEMVYFDAYEAQAGNILEDTTLIYTLIKNKLHGEK